MPGIVAIIGSKSNGNLIHSMARSITHEEWHRTDLFLKLPLAIGRVHLGTANPEKQPIFNEDRSLFIMMDGEVFGYEEEKKKLESRGHQFKVGNDPEYCLHLFEEYGEEFVEKLNGSFVIVIYDARHEKMIIANDRHGLRPFYYADDGDSYIFSAEVKAILRLGSFKKEIDDAAVADFFTFGRILGNKTFFRRIKLMLPATVATWSEGHLSERKYWSMKFEKGGLESSEEYCVNRLVALFAKAAERRTKGRHRLAVLLSGGLDSRTVAGALCKFHPVTTFTYGLRGGDEARIAEMTSKKLRAKHEFTEFRSDVLASFAEEAVYLTDGMLNVAHIYWSCVLQILKEHADIVFHGTSLDILLGTYLSRVAFRHSRDKISALFLEREISQAKGEAFTNLLYEELSGIIPDALAPSFYSRNYYEKIKGLPLKSLRESSKMIAETDSINKTDCFFLQHWARYNLSIVMLRNYIEDRVPSLDNEFFDFILTIPSKVRFGYRLYFKFLTKLAPDLAAIPYQRTGVPPKGPLISHRIGYVVKAGYKLFIKKLGEWTRGTISVPQNIGYPDLDDLIRKDVKNREFFESILLDEKTLSRGYFKREFIVKMLNEHMSGRKNWGMQLCAVLTFELWHRFFMDSTPEVESLKKKHMV